METNNSYKFRFLNSRDIELIILVEPEGIEIFSPPGDELTVVVAGPDEGKVVLEYTSDSRVTIWGWPDAAVSVYRGDQKLTFL